MMISHEDFKSEITKRLHPFRNILIQYPKTPAPDKLYHQGSLWVYHRGVKMEHLFLVYDRGVTLYHLVLGENREV